MIRSTMTWILFLIVHIKYTSSQEFEVRSSSEGCVLATPNITYSKDRNYIELPQNISTIQEGDYVQIGYRKAFGVFEYIGCTDVWYVPDTVIKHTVHSDPGQCYSACRTEYFAIYTTACYCLKTRLSHTHTRCNEECTSPNKTACGGFKWSRTYVSLYKYVHSENTENDNGHYFCRAYNTRAAIFEWGSCGFILRGICQSDTTDGYELAQYSTWLSYVNMCPSSNSFPASLNESETYTSDMYWVLWVGRIRSWVITRVNELDTADKYLDYRGYIAKEGGRYLLTFSKKQATSKKLCLKGRIPETSTEPSSTIPTTTSSVSSAATTTSSPASLSTISLSTTYSAVKNNGTQHDQQTQQLRQDCKEIIAVYVTVPVCIIVCVIVLVLFLISRRRAKAKGDSQNHDHNVSYASPHSIPSSTINNGMQNRAYEGDVDPKIKPVADPEYFVLEPSSKYSAVNNKSKHRAIEMTENENIIEDAYDTTATYTDNKRPNPKYGDDNVYNQLGEDKYGDNVYDQTGCVKPQTGFASDDDTYNHVGKDSDLDYSYNTLSGVVTSHKAAHDSENVYDHATR